MGSRVEDVRRRLGDHLPRLAAEHGVPGASVAVLVDGEVAAATHGVLNRRTGIDVTPDSLFMIQSITKVWTATLVMQLVDDGLIDLDAPITTYLPRFHTADESTSSRITVRHLLSHTGGFEGDIWAPTTAGDDALERFVEDLVSAAPQRTTPGELFSYCSAGYGVLGRLVEVLRGVPYATALRRHLAEPLGLDHLAFCADEALAFRTAIAHVGSSTDGTQRPTKVWAVMPPSNPAAGNQLAMTARGLIAFARMHLTDGLAPDGARVLSQSSARAMRERQVDHPAAVGPATGHGLGWWLSSRPGVVEHGGGTLGITALLRLVPGQDVAIAMLTNGGDAGPIVGKLLDPVLCDLTTGIPAASSPPTPAAGAEVTDPDRYVGTYETRPALHEVRHQHGRLWLTTSDRREALDQAEAAGMRAEPTHGELRRVEGDVFAVVDAQNTTRQLVEFVRSGERTEFLYDSRNAPRIE